MSTVDSASNNDECKSVTDLWDPIRRYVDKQTVVLSPSGKYELTIDVFNTNKDPNDMGRCWEYSQGIVRRKSVANATGDSRKGDTDGVEIACIKRNYWFTHGFFEAHGSEWLWSGSTYMSQCFVNLDTGVVYDNADTTKDCFCWVKVSPSTVTPSTTVNGRSILAVEGCYWGGPYMIQFYDFSDPANVRIIRFADQGDRYKEYYLMADNDPYEYKWVMDINSDASETLNCRFEYTAKQEYSNRFGKYTFDLDADEMTEDFDEYEHRFWYACTIAFRDSGGCEYSDSRGCIISPIQAEYVSVCPSDDFLNELYNDSHYKESYTRNIERIKKEHPVYLAVSGRDEFTITNLYFFEHESKIFADTPEIKGCHFGMWVVRKSDAWKYVIAYYPPTATSLENIVEYSLRKDAPFHNIEDCITFMLSSKNENSCVDS